mgnify:CR=1 FL=1
MQHIHRRSFMISTALTLAMAGLVPPVFAQDGKVLRRGLGSAPDTVDPGKAELHPASIVIYDLYEGLLTPGADGMPRPGAAEKWDISADGKTYVFKIRKGIKFSNGKELMPSDVYYISGVPTLVQVSDVAMVVAVAFVLCLLATIYPAWRASRTDPATALRYE